ncbi:hypothetical protein AAFF_G00209960 [Aldrovandia affinis]|uniref:Gypsy retrotransposon integrase-like protein 1 n=1 Tax=Aldrovandia affinis TaxID=143900 RepID=A0AAD7SWG7_9TELE|nr:hypothetical protein AAFF_G00209960 [Aldrovandia affinis]
MATDQASDPTVQTLKTMDTGLRLEEVAFGDTGATLLCDISTGQPRPVVPVSWRGPVFEAVHGLSHPGRKPSVRLVAAKFVWHGLRKDVKASPASIPRLHLPLHHGGQDDPLAGGSPPLLNASADLARAFIGAWVVRFGTPSDLSSDRGPQFTSELWSAVAEGLGVKLHRTTAYHPQANGLCERFHRSMKAALRASLKDRQLA